MFFKFYKRPLFKLINEHIIMYPSPININYLWSFGFLSLIVLILQIITGLLLSIHYTPHIDFAFLSVEHIMRDVNYGWILRYFHSNGASMFFIVIYIHIGKGLYFGSYLYPREFLWISGIIIFLLLMGTAFLGYVLPWGQMSFWGATVITNMVTAIPYIGEPILYWIWGGFAINNSTLNRIYTLHFLLPFILLGIVFLHLTLLHHVGSGNPLGIDWITYVSLYPYFIIKDFFIFIYFLIFYSIFIFLFPNFLGHFDNYIEANPYVTPAHVVPEWYFLPFYAILRSIPDKFWGVFLMLSAIIILILFPFITNYTFINKYLLSNNLYIFFEKNNYKNQNIFNELFSSFRSTKFRPIYKLFFWFLVCDFIFLGWIGMQPAEQPYILLGQIGLIYYFIFFLIIVPYLSLLEQMLLNIAQNSYYSFFQNIFGIQMKIIVIDKFEIYWSRLVKYWRIAYVYLIWFRSNGDLDNVGLVREFFKKQKWKYTFGYGMNAKMYWYKKFKFNAIVIRFLSHYYFLREDVEIFTLFEDELYKNIFISKEFWETFQMIHDFEYHFYKYYDYIKYITYYVPLNIYSLRKFNNVSYFYKIFLKIRQANPYWYYINMAEHLTDIQYKKIFTNNSIYQFNSSLYSEYLIAEQRQHLYIYFLRYYSIAMLIPEIEYRIQHKQKLARNDFLNEILHNVYAYYSLFIKTKYLKHK